MILCTPESHTFLWSESASSHEIPPGLRCDCGTYTSAGLRALQGRLAAAQAQVAWLKGALTAALDDLEARDELSALDGLRAALASGEPE